jgi:hypothetical protein
LIHFSAKHWIQTFFVGFRGFFRIPYQKALLRYSVKSFKGLQGCCLNIKVVQYKGGKIVPFWYFNNNFFTAAFKEVLKSTSGVDLGSDWLNYAIFFLVETKTRDTCFGDDAQKLLQDSL